jgi:hypothetical protein
MKKLLFLLALSLTSCAGLFVVNAELGMSEQDFKAQNVGEILVYAEKGVTAYRLQADKWFDTKFLYYYFSDGVLIEINEGEYQPDIIIQ